MAVLSFAARLSQLADARPAEVALVVVDPGGGSQQLTWSAFDIRTTSLAHELIARGTGLGTTVIVGFPNSIAHFVATWAVWKAGGLVLPLNPKAPQPEREAMIELAKPIVVFGDWDRPSRIS